MKKIITGMSSEVALVFGGTSGIGRAIAFEFARQGATVIIASRTISDLKATSSELRKISPLCSWAKCDLRKPQSIKALMYKIKDDYGKLTILVNNGGGPKWGGFEDTNDKDWQTTFETTVLAYIRATRLALPLLKSSSNGKILNIASSSAIAPLPNMILSNCFRLAVVGLTRTLATELAKYRIIVNSIAPGKVETPRSKKLDQTRAKMFGMAYNSLRNAYAAKIPLGRYAKPNEVAGVASFLCSEKNTYLTGQTLLVDGGLTQSY